jgi:hypothetical protein
LLQLSSQKSDVSSQRGKQKLPRLRLTSNARATSLPQ